MSSMIFEPLLPSFIRYKYKYRVKTWQSGIGSSDEQALAHFLWLFLQVVDAKYDEDGQKVSQQACADVYDELNPHTIRVVAAGASA
jgi:hypothetical protein